MPDITTVVKSLNEEIPQLLIEHDLPGLAIGICSASDILWSAGFGSTRAGDGHPVGTSTIFSGQSTSKMYTATAVLLAIQQGLVDLDEPVTSYLHEFTVNSRFESSPERRITLRHLLSHTAGFTHEAPIGSNTLVGRASFEKHCQSISDTWLRFPVGHHFEYSNLGIDLAGYILQRVSAKPFHEYMRRELLAPLGLTRTTFNHRVIARDTDRAIGHEANRKVPRLRMPMVAAGALYTSVDDALRYIQFHLRDGEGLLGVALLHEMSTPQLAAPGQRFGYGLGIGVSDLGGRRALGHGGGGFGFLCDFEWVPAADVGVVVLTNSVGHPLQGNLATRVLRDLTGPSAEPLEPPPRTVSLSSADLDRFVGEYVGRGSSKLTIRRDGSDLTWMAETERKPLHVVANDEIVHHDDPRRRFRLVDDADGYPTYLQNLYDGFTCYRNDPASRRPPTGPAIDSRWVGEYAVKASGRTVAKVRLGTDDGLSYLTDDHVQWRLDYHRPDIYYRCDGEVLDLTRNPPTCGNQRLDRIATSQTSIAGRESR